MPNENRNIVKKGEETEEKEKKQIRNVNKISLLGALAAAIIFLLASIAGVSTAGFHMACFSAFMVITAELYEWIIIFYAKKAEKARYNAKRQIYIGKVNFLKKHKYAPLVVAFAAIVISVTVVLVAGKYPEDATDIICATTVFGNILSYYFRVSFGTI